MIEEKRRKIDITNSGTPCANLPGILYDEAIVNDFGEVKLCLELENLGANIVTVVKDDICIFERPDGRELMVDFECESMEKIKILPGYRREICLRIMESCSYPVLSINDNRDSGPEQLIEFEITNEAICGDDNDDLPGSNMI